MFTQVVSKQEKTAFNVVFSVIYGILCHYGNFSYDTAYEKVIKYCHG